MKAPCFQCREEREIEPHSGLCLDCLIERAKHEKKPEDPLPFDHKAAAAGRESED